MSDTATAPVEPTEAEKATAPDEFDVMAWAADVAYPEAAPEIYNDGKTLKLLLEARIEHETAVRQHPAETNRKKRQTLSITDDEDELPKHPSVLAAEDKIRELQATLKKTARKFILTGIAPEERVLLEKKIAASLHAKPATFEEVEGVRVETDPGHPGGTEHPDYDDLFAAELISRSVHAVELPTGARKEFHLSPEEVVALKGKLPAMESTRLHNAAFAVNYLRYDIEQIVTEDFS